MGLVNFVISTVAKCLDAMCLVLDLNFLVVHNVVRTVLAVFTFITDLPTLLLNSEQELEEFVVFGLMFVAEASSSMAQNAIIMLGSVPLALEGLLESLKMVGYLSMHILIRGKEHLCRGVLWILDICGIVLSLLVYFINTVVNFALIAIASVYSAVVSLLLTVTSPFQMVLELTLTFVTFLYSSLLGTSAFLWTPCKLLLDFMVSLVHMFISIFILNIYGLMLTLTIALTTTAYLNPELSRQVAAQVLDYLNSFPALCRLFTASRRLASASWRATQALHVNNLQRIFHHLYILERRLWRQLSQHRGQLGLVLRTLLHRDNSRVEGDGNTEGDRRGPPDGRAGDGAQRELLNVVLPSSSTDRPLKKLTSSGKGGKAVPAERLLTLLKEQEDRKKCVICQDCNKTVVLLPCRHLCLCKDCTNILLQQPIYQQNCPLCRHMILNTMDVYL